MERALRQVLSALPKARQLLTTAARPVRRRLACHELPEPPGVSEAGSAVWGRRFFQNRDVQRLIGHQLLKLSVLGLQRFESTSLVHPQSTVLLPPAVVGLFGNPQLADDRTAVCEFRHIRIRKLQRRVEPPPSAHGFPEVQIRRESVLPRQQLRFPTVLVACRFVAPSERRSHEDGDLSSGGSVADELAGAR